MKQILEYFGGTIIAVFVAGCVMGLFYDLPISLGKIADESLNFPKATIGENQAFMEYQTSPRWKVSMKESYNIQTGITYEVEDFFVVTDPAGEEQRIWFSEGWYAGNPDVRMTIDNGGKAFCCSHPGVYLVTLESYSPETGYFETQLRILVNGEALL